MKLSPQNSLSGSYSKSQTSKALGFTRANQPVIALRVLTVHLFFWGQKEGLDQEMVKQKNYVRRPED